MSRTIIFSTRNWQGKYWSRDIPHGVETTPCTTGIFLVNTSGDAPLRKLAAIQGEAPGYSPDGLWVYFQMKDKGHYNIFRCREDGSGVTCITSAHKPEGDRFGWKFSPDGKKLTYTFFDGKIGRVGIMNPDGRHIAFVSWEGDYTQLFIIPAEGGTPEQLTDIQGAAYFLNWRP